MIIRIPAIITPPSQLTLSGATLDTTVLTGQSPLEVYLVFNRDGTIDREYTWAGGGSVTQLSSATDWINPDRQHATVGDGYEVRYVDTPATTFDSDPAGGVNNWVDISADRKFGYVRAGIGADSSGGFITFEIRPVGASSARATGEYSIRAEITSF